MPAIDFAALARPVSDAQVCGPDLDLAGDPNFLNFLANAEGLLSKSFFEFDRGAIDFGAQLAAAAALLAETRDLRLLVTCAKLFVLDRDLAGFSASIGTIADLLADRWDDVHPRVENGDALVRIAPLQSLDDMSTVVLPLQYMPLVRTDRQGVVSYRSQMIATGEVKARPNEQAFDAGSIDKALMDADLQELIEPRDRLAAIRSALKRIREITAERVGYEQAVDLERLPQLVARMLALLENVIGRRDPSAMLQAAPEEFAGEAADTGEASTAAAPAAARGRVRSVEEATEALAAVAAYFSRVEPSSPALLLVRQAQQLVGKSIFEVLRILVPARLDAAQVSIGAEQAISLPLGRLSELPKADAVAHGSGNGAAPPDGPAGPHSASGGGSPQAIGEVRLRGDAIGLLEDVGAFYRAVEPSSPIPLLTDRARSFVGGDFINILRDLLPEPPAPPPKK